MYVRLREINNHSHKKMILLLILTPISDAYFICMVLLIAQEAYFHIGRKASGQKAILLLMLLIFYLMNYYYFVLLYPDLMRAGAINRPDVVIILAISLCHFFPKIIFGKIFCLVINCCQIARIIEIKFLAIMFIDGAGYSCFVKKSATAINSEHPFARRVIDVLMMIMKIRMKHFMVQSNVRISFAPRLVNQVLNVRTHYFIFRIENDCFSIT